MALDVLSFRPGHDDICTSSVVGLRVRCGACLDRSHVALPFLVAYTTINNRCLYSYNSFQPQTFRPKHRYICQKWVEEI